jgi:hypothetical protein
MNRLSAFGPTARPQRTSKGNVLLVDSPASGAQFASSTPRFGGDTPPWGGNRGGRRRGDRWLGVVSDLDFHRPDAIRILDFPYAGEYVSQIGPAVFGEGTPATETRLTGQLYHLKHDGPTAVLAEARQLTAAHPDLSELPKHLAYLEKREPHMPYPAFQVAGWPIGDGAVESGNKLVVEARLKGSGMHWARPDRRSCRPDAGPARGSVSLATTAGKKLGRRSRENCVGRRPSIAPSCGKSGKHAARSCRR